MRLNYQYPINSGRLAALLRAGGGVYLPTSGSTSLGFVLGSGLVWRLNPSINIFSGLEHHEVDYEQSGSFDKARFLVFIPFGINFSF